MREKMAHVRHGWFLWIGGACFLVGSLVAGSLSWASLASAGPTVSGSVTANQGAPGTTAWPVSGAVSVDNLPATQAVSGTVNVGNLPATQTVTSGDQTQALFDNNYTLDATGVAHLGFFNVSAYRQVRLLVATDDGSTQQVSLGEAAGGRSVPFDLFNVSGGGQNRTYDTPGLELEVDILGPPGAIGSLLLVGRSN